ncbi:RidA family protein [Aestuariispira ectoiniformans]|uniref:RidA family protein n=1 Tax=Aestuariispira ectoiniformans TaxID=2775080 RepID=UPI00223B0B7D|nr:RidA family protein [Aestuariispira ectoiniformans]
MPQTLTPGEALEALGLTLPKPPAAPGSFVGALVHGGQVIVSGQVPLHNGQVFATGRLGDDISIETGQEAARICLLNALAQLSHATGGLDNVKGFGRMAGYVSATPDFTQHGAVIEAASELLVQIFGDKGAHARCAIGVASLPRGVPVEIELTAFL